MSAVRTDLARLRVGHLHRRTAVMCRPVRANVKSAERPREIPRGHRSGQRQLACEEGFRVFLRRTAFHASEPRQSAKGLRVKPLLGTLAAEV